MNPASPFAPTRRLLLLGAGAGLVAPGIFATPLPAAAQQPQGAVIDVTRARTDPIPVAIPDLAGGERGRDIARVIQANLRNSACSPVDRQATSRREAAAQTRASRTARARRPGSGEGG